LTCLLEKTIPPSFALALSTVTVITLSIPPFSHTFEQVLPNIFALMTLHKEEIDDLLV
jgi:hypothetical protein